MNDNIDITNSNNITKANTVINNTVFYSSTTAQQNIIIIINHHRNAFIMIITFVNDNHEHGYHYQRNNAKVLMLPQATRW